MTEAFGELTRGAPTSGIRVLLVVNPAAGDVSARLLASARTTWEAHGARVFAVTTTHPGEAIGLVAAEVVREAVDVVCAVGGDGTVREVAEGISRGSGTWDATGRAGAAPTLAVVPAGRGNSAYAALWPASHWPRALEAAAGSPAARRRPIDLARLVGADRAVVLGLSCGLIARIAELAAERPRNDETRYRRAIEAALAEMRPFEGVVEVDGEVLYAGAITNVTVGGVRRFGGGAFELLPRSKFDDGLLDVCAIGELDDAQVADLTALVPVGRHLDHPCVRYASGRVVSIDRADGSALSVEHDGDVWLDCGARVDVAVVPRAVDVVDTV